MIRCIYGSWCAHLLGDAAFRCPTKRAESDKECVMGLLGRGEQHIQTLHGGHLRLCCSSRTCSVRQKPEPPQPLQQMSSGDARCQLLLDHHQSCTKLIRPASLSGPQGCPVPCRMAAKQSEQLHLLAGKSRAGLRACPESAWAKWRHDSSCCVAVHSAVPLMNFLN